MDWDDYRYFLAIATAGSLSGAARTLKVNQSTVGRRLATLENRVRTQLFDRTPEGYVLTAAGESVRQQVDQLDHGFLAVERRLAGRETRLEGTVRIAVTEMLANAFLIPHLHVLRDQHPGLTLDLLTGNAPVDLARREADLAVRIGIAPKQPNLVVRQIGVAGFALFASRAYLARHGSPRLRSGLGGHQVVGYSGDLAAAPLARWLAERAHAAAIVLRANSVVTAFQAVAAGIGIGVLPCMVGRELEQIGAVGGQIPVRTVVHQDLVRHAGIRAVQSFLTDAVRRGALAS